MIHKIYIHKLNEIYYLKGHTCTYVKIKMSPSSSFRVAEKKSVYGNTVIKKFKNCIGTTQTKPFKKIFMSDIWCFVRCGVLQTSLILIYNLA